MTSPIAQLVNRVAASTQFANRSPHSEEKEAASEKLIDAFVKKQDVVTLAEDLGELKSTDTPHLAQHAPARLHAEQRVAIALDRALVGRLSEAARQKLDEIIRSKADPSTRNSEIEKLCQSDVLHAASWRAEKLRDRIVGLNQTELSELQLKSAEGELDDAIKILHALLDGNPKAAAHEIEFCNEVLSGLGQQRHAFGARHVFNHE